MAFFQNQASAEALESLRQDRLFIRSRIDVQMGGIDQAIQDLAEPKEPSLLIVETDAKGDAMMAKLGALADLVVPGTRVVLIGAENDIELFRTLKSQGLAEYFLSPAKADQLRAAIADIFREREGGTEGHVIAVTGVHGGAGASSVAQNLGYSLAHHEESDVIVVDLDLLFGTVALDFNVQPRQTLADALAETSRLDASMMDRMLVRFDDRISLLAAPAALGTGVRVTQENIRAVLGLVAKMADHVILDIPHVWEPWSQELLVQAKEAVLVAYPDLANLRDAKNMLEFLAERRGMDAPPRLVFNRVGLSKKTELSAKDFKGGLDVEPLGSVPFDALLFGNALNNGEIAIAAAKKHKVTQEIARLAKILSGRAPAARQKGLLGVLSK